MNDRDAVKWTAAKFMALATAPENGNVPVSDREVFLTTLPEKESRAVISTDVTLVNTVVKFSDAVNIRDVALLWFPEKESIAAKDLIRTRLGMFPTNVRFAASALACAFFMLPERDRLPIIAARTIFRFEILPTKVSVPVIARTMLREDTPPTKVNAAVRDLVIARDGMAPAKLRTPETACV